MLHSNQTPSFIWPFGHLPQPAPLSTGHPGLQHWYYDWMTDDDSTLQFGSMPMDTIMDHANVLSFSKVFRVTVISESRDRPGGCVHMMYRYFHYRLALGARGLFSHFDFSPRYESESHLCTRIHTLYFSTDDLLDSHFEESSTPPCVFLKSHTFAPSTWYFSSLATPSSYTRFTQLRVLIIVMMLKTTKLI